MGTTGRWFCTPTPKVLSGINVREHWKQVKGEPKSPNRFECTIQHLIGAPGDIGEEFPVQLLDAQQVVSSFRARAENDIARIQGPNGTL